MLFHTLLTKLCAKTIKDRVSPLKIANTTEYAYHNDSRVRCTVIPWKLNIYI